MATQEQVDAAVKKFAIAFKPTPPSRVGDGGYATFVRSAK